MRKFFGYIFFNYKIYFYQVMEKNNSSKRLRYIYSEWEIKFPGEAMGKVFYDALRSDSTQYEWQIG